MNIRRKIKYGLIDCITLLGSGAVGFARGQGLPIEPVYDIGAFTVPIMVRGFATSNQKKVSLSARINENPSIRTTIDTIHERESLDDFANKSSIIISGIGGGILGAVGYFSGLTLGYLSR